MLVTWSANLFRMLELNFFLSFSQLKIRWISNIWTRFEDMFMLERYFTMINV